MENNNDFIIMHEEVEIDLSRIKLNKVYKNWRAVCDELKIDYDRFGRGSTGMKLKSQIDLYFEYERKINGAYDYKFTKYKTAPIIDLTGMRNKNKIVKLALVNTIARYVQNNPDSYNTTIVFNWDKLFKVLGIVNRNYLTYQTKQTELAEELNTSEFVVSDFYQKAKGTIKRAITTSLNSLERDNALRWYSTFKISYYDEDNQSYEMKIADDKDIRLVLESDDKAYKHIYKKMVSTKKSYTDNFATQKIKAIGYLTSTERWFMFYDLRNKFMTQIWNEKNDTNYIVKDMYKVVKIVENIYRFKGYGDILDRYNFNPYQLSETMQDILVSNAENRHIRDKNIIKECAINNDVARYGELKPRILITSDEDFVYNFWATVEYCMEDAYDANQIITDMNL